METDPAKIDAQLLPLLEARDDAQREDLLAELIARQAGEVVRPAVARKMLSAGDWSLAHRDADDVRSEINLRLLVRLRAFVSNPVENAIANFRAYAAVTAYNTCHEFLRRRFPCWWRLKNTIRYALSHQDHLAIWENERGEWICGLRGWRGRAPAANAGEVPQTVAAIQDPSTAITEVLRALDAPIELDELTGVLAGLWGVRDNDHSEDVDTLPDRRGGVGSDFDQRAFLGQMWSEVRLLPVRQRAALLLNLREPDGNGVIELFPLTGIASLRQIAEVLEMTAGQLAELWNDLPLDDLRIAERMGLTRQQVINLRKAARSRLARRLKC